MKRALSVSICITLLSLLLTSCGSNGSTKLDITMDDFSYSPMEVTIPAGQEITVTVTNKGTEEHEWVLFQLGKDAGESFGDEDEGNIYWEIEAEAGESKTETFTAPTDAGEYYITCGVEEHLEEGMIGKVVVVK